MEKPLLSYPGIDGNGSMIDSWADVPPTLRAPSLSPGEPSALGPKLAFLKFEPLLGD